MLLMSHDNRKRADSKQRRSFLAQLFAARDAERYVFFVPAVFVRVF